MHACIYLSSLPTPGRRSTRPRRSRKAAASNIQAAPNKQTKPALSSTSTSSNAQHTVLLRIRRAIHLVHQNATEQPSTHSQPARAASPPAAPMASKRIMKGKNAGLIDQTACLPCGAGEGEGEAFAGACGDLRAFPRPSYSFSQSWRTSSAIPQQTAGEGPWWGGFWWDGEGLRA